MNSLATPARYSRVIWILLDGLRPDKLRACGHTGVRRHYLDELLESGLLFQNMYTGSGCSKTSLHAAFTSMYGASNGVNAYTQDSILRLDPWVLTLPDHLKRAGFRNFRYCDKNDLECYATPKSGFDVWEDSGFERLAHTPGYTFELPARQRFIDQFNAHTGPSFAFFHLLSLHDICGDKQVYHWTSDFYEATIERQSEELRRLITDLHVDARTLLVLSADHGVMLDAHRLRVTKAQGVRLEDTHMRVFCGFMGQGLVGRKVQSLTRTIDIAPTILEAVGAPAMGAQGVSLWGASRGEAAPELEVLMARDSAYEEPAWSESPCVFGIRTNRWKYVTHRFRPESTWLMDLEHDLDYQVNLAGRGLPIERELHQKVLRELVLAPPKPVELYHRHHAPFCREDLVPQVRIILPLADAAQRAIPCLYSLFHQVGFYAEWVVLDGATGDQLFRELQKEFWPRPHFDLRRVRPGTLSHQVAAAAGAGLGELVMVAKPEVVYPPDFIYQLHQRLVGAGGQTVSRAANEGAASPLGWLFRRPTLAPADSARCAEQIPGRDQASLERADTPGVESELNRPRATSRSLEARAVPAF